MRLSGDVSMGMNWHLEISDTFTGTNSNLHEY